MKKVRKNTAQYHILTALERVMEGTIAFADFFDNPGKFAWTGYRTDPNNFCFYRAVRELKGKGYVETYKDGRKLMLKLTDEAKQRKIMKKISENKKWDGKWRIVIFDIPEKHRKLRDVLRGKLREWEFVPVQKSVWASKKDGARQIREFTVEIGLSDWVKIFVARSQV